MNSTLDPDQVLEMILEHSLKFSNAESGSLMLVNSRESVLDIVTYRGHDPEIKKEFRLKIGQGITGLVASSGRGMIVNDVSKDPNYISIKKEIQSELAVPLIVEDMVIGVVSLDSNRINAFTEEHLKIVGILANQAALIFKNLQTFRRLEQKNKIQQVLIEISKIVTSSLDLDEIFQSIMATIERSLKLEKGSLVLYDNASETLRLVAAVGLSTDEIEKGVYQLGEGVVGKVYESGEAMLIRSVANDPLFLNRVGYLNHFKNDPHNVSLLAAPVKSEQSIIGVLSVFLVHQKNMDTQTYLDFLQVVASIISQALKIRQLVDDVKKEISRENILLKRELKEKYKFGSIIGRSKNMEKLFEKIQLVSDSRASVLITGESGTGKEMIASAIHYNSNRSEKPFIKINCAAIPENLLESELFGHTKGSFTGAVSDKKGKFEIADGGTIFLDEIGEMDLNLQSKLLRVLQEKEIEAVGSLKVKKVDIRILAATNANLETLITEKKFRSDLYYRLNVVNIHTPPLRERTEDIPLLTIHFIEKYSKENNKNIKGFTREVQKLLALYPWPGNVRELENVIERAVVMTQNSMLDESDFVEITEKLQSMNLPIAKVSEETSSDLSAGLYSMPNLDAIDGRALEVVVGEVEARLIQYALKKFRYTKTRVAKFLGINRNTLDKRIKELKIEY
ncbi:MAG TPA: sigma 54-interacting transcriptional regulator [Leptospiraceae bacterium]|nr:sigma 54-interacting transcriptional regulator [Leptospiraceae bacterium]HMW05960.1 sigma 54-interacting transcriptional regulator [Leptospiraceae bacterium]HMX32108.1 sigma 54-interacting transcriptional regulator [Leptospiraceae bacterium]HMY32314.1 sigma 54-interacting transcriptional regulator [Leptospiraceae bacterium]HMZ62484.1 sigma 54-interacting transcriptional regulator [Leptospiraceae bacterium]